MRSVGVPKYTLRMCSLITFTLHCYNMMYIETSCHFTTDHEIGSVIVKPAP